MKSKKQIIFSLPVHEQYDVVINQINNINHFCNNVTFTIILHLSKYFTLSESEIQQLSAFENVVINPLRLYSGHMDGSLLRIHVENAKFAKERFDFNHFVFLSSNMMFIKNMPSLNSKIGPIRFIYSSDSTWEIWDSVLRDITLNKLLKTIKNPLYVCVQIDGWYVSYDILKLLINRIDPIYPKNRYRDLVIKFLCKILLVERVFLKLFQFFKIYKLESVLAKHSKFYSITYPTEEVYLSTLIYSLGLIKMDFSAQNTTSLCYMEWKGARNEIKDISLIPSNYCSIKPVNRTLESPLRKVITGLMSK